MPPSRILTTAAVTVATAIATCAPAMALTLEPAPPVERFRAILTTAGGGQSSIAWDGPERFAIRELRGGLGTGNVVRDGSTETADFGTGNGSVIRRSFPGPGLDFIDGSLDVLIARVRAGTARLTPVRVRGRAVLRGRLRLPANDCAALRAGTKTIDLDARTLLPLRIVIRRAGVRQRRDVTSLRYTSINRPLPAGAFRPARVGDRPFREDLGFRRTSPARAAEALSYAPELPASLPDGFAPLVSGWAPRSLLSGPEGSIAPHREFFAASFARGAERIDVTQRIGRPGDWEVSPLGAECQPLGEVDVEIDGTPAKYAIGAQTTPHLYWREGRILHTLSGPYPRATLVAIAESLAAVR